MVKWHRPHTLNFQRSSSFQGLGDFFSYYFHSLKKKKKKGLDKKFVYAHTHSHGHRLARGDLTMQSGKTWVGLLSVKNRCLQMNRVNHSKWRDASRWRRMNERWMEAKGWKTERLICVIPSWNWTFKCNIQFPPSWTRKGERAGTEKLFWLIIITK